MQIDPSFLRRKLKTNKELTLSESETVERFLAASASDSDAAEVASGRRVEVYGYAAMGGSEDEASDGEEFIALGTAAVLDWMTLPAGIDPTGECFVLIPSGASMEPRIFAGEALLVLKDRPPTRNGDALIEFRNGSGVVKSYAGTRNGRVYGQQFNPPKMKDWDASSVKGVHRLIRL